MPSAPAEIVPLLLYMYDLTFSAEQEVFGSGTPIAPAKKVTSFEIHWHHGTVLCWASEPGRDFCGE